MTRQIKTDPRLAALTGLFEASFQAAQADHAAARANTAALEEKIAKLRHRQQQLTKTAKLDAADVLNAGRHRAWILQQIKALNLELARARVDEENARTALAHENGRRQVLAKLVE